MALPGYLQTHPDGTLLFVKVQPRSSRTGLGQPLGNELKINVTSPPVESAANETLVRFLAEALDCPRNAVRLLRGQTSRHKTLLLAGLSPQTVAERLFQGSD